MKRTILSVLAALLALTGFTKEGMWVPMLVDQLNIDDMRSMGMKLTAEEIYAVNQSSLKDAVVHFGGGCTAEVISNQGLLLTNHHCGYGEIQSHSSVENDYLKNGFWAMDKEEELPNPGLTATFIVRMEDVTGEVLGGLEETPDAAEKKKIIQQRIDSIGKKAVEGTHYDYIIKPFYYGNEYYMFITETFKDVRLVGAPPSSIGKFGFDTDNWVWPRHTGDFSIFRIYADKNNQPAEYSEDNVPYQPRHSFPISLKPVDKGDFTMVYGFPGRTQEYVTSYAIDYILNKSNPAKIYMREQSLEVINKAMAQSDERRIQYAAKQSSISNYHKKWIGESKGLKRLNAVEKKKAFEDKFQQKVTDSPEWFEKYGEVLPRLKKLHEEIEKYEFAREMFIELYYYGPDILRFTYDFKGLITTRLEEDTTDKVVEGVAHKLKPKLKSFHKDFNAEVDKQMFAALTEVYAQMVDESLAPAYKALVQDKYDGDYRAYADKVFRKTIYKDRVDVSGILYDPKKRMVKKLKKDPLFEVVDQLIGQYTSEIRPEYSRIGAEIEKLNKLYMEAQMEVMPDAKKYYPDANSTLRISYGKVKGYEPKDGVYYHHFTTLEGVMEKYVPGDREFDVPEKLRGLYAAKNFGRYDYNGVMPVCFIASNHTTGGNSGSPVLDANGNLKGLNFDRCWEGTMSDLMFDPDRCRNIMVDLNYVLFIVDKFAGAGHLIDEMELIE